MKYKKFLLVVLIMLFLAGGISLIVFMDMDDNNNSENTNASNFSKERKVYEALVAVRDQKESDPEEDRKNSMKKGYVIGVYNEGQKWSDTEKTSYLILKINLTEEERDILVRPVEREAEIVVPMERGTGGKEMQKEIISLREFRIDLEKIGFDDPDILLKEQPFRDKIFGWEIVKKSQ